MLTVPILLNPVPVGPRDRLCSPIDDDADLDSMPALDRMHGSLTCLHHSIAALPVAITPNSLFHIERRIVHGSSAGATVTTAPFLLMRSWRRSTAFPLFMKSLPEDVADNPVVGALQSLAYEGAPDGKLQAISLY